MLNNLVSSLDSTSFAHTSRMHMMDAHEHKKNLPFGLFSTEIFTAFRVGLDIRGMIP